jgi:hypothetical protein
MTDRSNTFQRTQCNMSWTLRITWGWALLCNMMTPLMNMLGCLLLMAIQRSQKHSTIALCVDGYWCNPKHQVTEWQLIGPVWMDTAAGTPAFNCVTLFPCALMCPFCCTACRQLLVCQAHSHMITCDQPNSLAVLWTGLIWITLIQLLKDSYYVEWKSFSKKKFGLGLRSLIPSCWQSQQESFN